MTLLDFLRNKQEFTPRGKRVHIPNPPSEYSARDYLEHRPSEVFHSHDKHSIERKATNYLVAALRTPVPPFLHSTKPIVPVPEPHFTPPRSTLDLKSPRWTCPTVRDANNLHFIPNVSAAETFFERTIQSDGTIELSLRRSPRRHHHSAAVSSASSSVSLGSSDCDSHVAHTVLARRTPRHEISKLNRNAEGVYQTDSTTSKREMQALAKLPVITTASCYQYRASAQDQDMRERQKTFERSMLSPRTVMMELGKFDVKLHA